MSTRYQIVMRSGPTVGATYALDAEFITIGRDPSNLISINDPEISRQHAKMMLQGGKIVLEDNGSTNGTSVDGMRLSGPHVLKPGETISLGEDITFVFEALSFDPDATVLSSSKSPAVPEQTFGAPPPPPPAYSGHIPAGPAPIMPPPAPKADGRKVVPIALGVGALVTICACGGFLFWVDAANKWCDFFPFLFGVACP